jgi:hypothetical protein
MIVLFASDISWDIYTNCLNDNEDKDEDDDYDNANVDEGSATRNILFWYMP